MQKAVQSIKPHRLSRSRFFRSIQTHSRSVPCLQSADSSSHSSHCRETPVTMQTSQFCVTLQATMTTVLLRQEQVRVAVAAQVARHCRPKRNRLCKDISAINMHCKCFSQGVKVKKEAGCLLCILAGTGRTAIWRWLGVALAL